MELKCHSHSLIRLSSLIFLFSFAATNAPTSGAACVTRDRSAHHIVSRNARTSPPLAESVAVTPSSAPSPATLSYNNNNYAPIPSPESEPATLAPSSAPSPSPYSSYHPTPDADDTNYDKLDAPVASPSNDDCNPPSSDPPSTTSFDHTAEPPSTTTSFDAGNDKHASTDPLTGIAGSLFLKKQPFRIPKLVPANPSLKKLCASTDYPALCVASLSPFHLSGRVDSAFALEVAIKATAKHARLAASAAGRLAAASSAAGDEETAVGLGTCKDVYGDALDDLESAADALGSRDVGTINSMLSAVVTDSETCEDIFVGGESPLFNYNDKLRKMASNCLAIASTIN